MITVGSDILMLSRLSTAGKLLQSASISRGAISRTIVTLFHHFGEEPRNQISCDGDDPVAAVRVTRLVAFVVVARPCHHAHV
eukprot:SAG31_NODE_978_length_10615_cov_4.488208_4_plen_82_part_00